MKVQQKRLKLPDFSSIVALKGHRLTIYGVPLYIIDSYTKKLNSY